MHQQAATTDHPGSGRGTPTFRSTQRQPSQIRCADASSAAVRSVGHAKSQRTTDTDTQVFWRLDLQLLYVVCLVCSINDLLEFYFFFDHYRFIAVFRYF